MIEIMYLGNIYRFGRVSCISSCIYMLFSIVYHAYVYHTFFHDYMISILYMTSLSFLLDLVLSQPQGRGRRATLRGRLVGILTLIDLYFSGFSRSSIEMSSDKDIGSRLFY